MKFFAGTLFGFGCYGVLLVIALTQSKSSHRQLMEILDAVGPIKS